MESHSLNRLWKSAGYSWKGITATWSTSPAFREECFLSLILIPIALYLNINPLEKLWLISVTIFVPLIELINSAIETTIDRISYEYNSLSAQAKDMGSAAVLFSLIIMVVSWATILFKDI